MKVCNSKNAFNGEKRKKKENTQNKTDMKKYVVCARTLF